MFEQQSESTTTRIVLPPLVKSSNSSNKTPLLINRLEASASLAAASSNLRSPLVMENNLSKAREFIEVSVDRFDVLTRFQPQQQHQLELHSQPTHHQVSSSLHHHHHQHRPSNRRLSALNLPKTPIDFKWYTENMPRLKLKKANDETTCLLVSQDDRRRRATFEQRRLAEEKEAAKLVREKKSLEYQLHSEEVRKKIRRRAAAENENRSDVWGAKSNNYRFDVWSSDNSKDIALQKEIIKGFYETDNRRIRHHKNNDRPGFFEWRANNCFDECQQKLFVAAAATDQVNSSNNQQSHDLEGTLNTTTVVDS